MNEQAFIEITLTRRPDDSYYYKNMRDYEKKRIFNAVSVATTLDSIIFAAGGHTYEFELNKWSCYMLPMVG